MRGQKAIDSVGTTLHSCFVHTTYKRIWENYSRCWVECFCGNVFSCLLNNLRTGLTKSCGCIHVAEASAMVQVMCKTHGRHGTPEYKAWQSMRQRCYNHLASGYSDYGGRGIRVCQAWRENFESFFSGMGEKPSAEYSLDRIDNDGNYEPGNCKWSTKSEQRKNQRKRVL